MLVGTTFILRAFEDPNQISLQPAYCICSNNAHVVVFYVVVRLYNRVLF